MLVLLCRDLDYFCNAGYHTASRLFSGSQVQLRHGECKTPEGELEIGSHPTNYPQLAIFLCLLLSISRKCLQSKMQHNLCAVL